MPGSEEAVSQALLQRLEELVAAATEEIGSLRQANQALEEKVAGLEQEREAGQGELSAWSEKEAEIEAKLEGLVNGLESLLGD